MEDLGTWPAEQATVLLEVLHKAGLTPEAKRTRQGVAVAVPDGESDEAHRQLAANMDTIAKAARTSAAHRSRGGQRVQRPASRTSGGERPLASQRLLRIARPIALLLIGLLVIGTIGSGITPLLTIAVVVGVVYVIGRRAQQRGEGG